MRPHRVLAVVSRHGYLHRRSPIRALELLYWPFLELLVWGFVSIWIQTVAGAAGNFIAFFLGGFILWDLMFRAQQGLSMAYLEEVWSRNLMNLFVSPLTVGEFLAASGVVSLVKLTISTVVMAFLAATMYGFNVLTLGLSLVPFIAILLVFGWSMGVATMGLVMRFGQGAESLVWVVSFVIQPIACVFYPLSTLPTWLQPVALATPLVHVFEGMRAVIAGGGVPWRHLAIGAGLDLLYVIAAIAFFHKIFAIVRDRGLLARTGE